MTGVAVVMKVNEILRQQLGMKPGDPLIEHSGAKNLQEAIMCTSLDTVSIQLACEEAFGLKFATGPADRGAIDEEWDHLGSTGALVDLVMRHQKVAP